MEVPAPPQSKLSRKFKPTSPVPVMLPFDTHTILTRCIIIYLRTYRSLFTSENVYKEKEDRSGTVA